MAEAIVGEAVLSAALQVLFAKMDPVMNFIRRRKISDAPLKKLKITLLAVNAVLNDAEEKQITNPAVKAWLDELKDATYDAEDLLDEIATEDLRCDLEAESRTTMDQVQNFFSTSLNLFDHEGINSKIEEILNKLEYIANQKDGLGLKDVGGKPSQKVPTTSLVDESGVYGRDDDKEKIIKSLLSDDASGNDICVITIVGMGGVGKTTLAQLVYNDDRLKDFTLRAWVCVSEEFNVLRVTKTILHAVTSSACDTDDLNLLQVRLKERLTGKKFLLILDDVWNENYNDWVILRSPFRFAEKGSKIIVTTRNESVASIMQTVPSHHLKELMDEDCWLLFAKHAFYKGNSSAHPDLEVIGRKIVKRCRGLPLAAKTLGGLLRSKVDAEDWDEILKNNIWDLPNAKNNILPALRLSYHYLPSHLKRCFAFCSIFPKDYVFRKEQLVLLWMAEDLLQQPKSNKRMEKLGYEYFDDLISRSFFQRLRGDDLISRSFVMHDLINDLAKFVSGDFCFRLEGDNPHEFSEKTRHLSYSRMNYDDSKKFEAFNDAKCLRTFLPLNPFLRIEDYYLTDKVPHDLLPTLRRLRVLSLSQYKNISELPDSIGSLKHLRYLDLSRTGIRKLPKSTSTLYNLQTLKLSYCHSLIELPESIGNLKHLRYLDLASCTKIRKLPESTSTLYSLQTLNLSYCDSLVELPANMHRLINLCHLDVSGIPYLKETPRHMSRSRSLQTLSTFIVGKHKGSMISELGELQHLRGELHILGLQNVVQATDALKANLKDKKYLDTLELEWGFDTEDSQNERDVLDELQPHKNLKRLTINYYGGTRFPDWLGDHSFCDMVSLSLRGCKYCFSLPPLGQLPCLKYLSISSCPSLVSFPRGGLPTTLIFLSIFFCEKLEFPIPEETMHNYYASLQTLDLQISCDSLKSFSLGLFPKLNFLTITNCRNLESLWIAEGFHDDLTSLSSLYISGCPKLKSLPQRMHTLLPSLWSLDILGCPELESFPEGGLPSNLISLKVGDCDKLTARRMEWVLQGLPSTITHISISHLPNLKYLDNGGVQHLTSLKNLYIKDCMNLESLWIPDTLHEDLTSLSTLSILSCPKLESFPKGGLPAPNLKSFEVSNCKNLKSLPERMHTLLPSIRRLDINGCPELESFPEGGLPSNLGSLIVHNCGKLMARRMEWGLQRLPSLESFDISRCEEVESFPEEGLLPSTLTSISISSLQNLKYLDMRGLQHLTSLEKLYIDDCPQLQCLPEEGLPTSLYLLRIVNCPWLKQRCQREKGEDWSKIAHIPQILIDEVLIS